MPSYVALARRHVEDVAKLQRLIKRLRSQLEALSAENQEACNKADRLDTENRGLQAKIEQLKSTIEAAHELVD